VCYKDGRAGNRIITREKPVNIRTNSMVKYTSTNKKGKIIIKFHIEK